MNLGAIEASIRQATGRRLVVEDIVTPSVVERLAATLGSKGAVPRAGDALPPGWQTVFCLLAPSSSELGVDGLPSGFDLIPPVPMQRRMFGGARMEFRDPLILGALVRCESEVRDVKLRTTATAHLAIVTLRRSYYGPAGLAVVEDQDIIHLEPIGGAADKPTGTKEATPAPTWQRTLTPDPVMLFRFSALCFNSHRIHYDMPYAAEVEKLPGLVVQGKLIALLLLETVRDAVPGARVARFEYRSGRPLYAGTTTTFAARRDDDGTNVRLWAADASGANVQTASLALGRS